ncbi:MAG: hypothetical protein V1874_06175 [Spirochaetota bacterium]
MLKETANVQQIDGEHKRRWFWSDYFDLIVWISDENNIMGFQLCYDIRKNQRVLTWKKETGFSHDKIDDGESQSGKHKASPILTADGIFEKENVSAAFRNESRDIDKQIADFVYSKILEYVL